MMKILLADDLTGCCDAGIKFASSGVPVCVCISPDFLLDSFPVAVDLLAVNVDTRALFPEKAAAVTRKVCERIKAKTSGAPGLLYKKIDSTMRGNPGAEIRAVAEAWGCDKVFVAVASPEMGRTVRNGILSIDGVPLADTAFGSDPGSPMLESDILKILDDYLRGSTLVSHDLLHGAMAMLEHEIASQPSASPRYFVFDSENQQDLDDIARMGLSMRPRPLFAGSAGLARGLSKALVSEKSAVQALHLQKMLFVCGSANRATHAQIDAFQAAGFPVLTLPSPLSSGQIWAYSQNASALLQEGSICLTVTRERLSNPELATAQLSALAEITLNILGDVSPALCGLFLTGGETAFFILNRIAHKMTLVSEPLPGIVAAVLADGPLKGMVLVTKAGGFGAKNTFLELLQILK